MLNHEKYQQQVKFYQHCRENIDQLMKQNDLGPTDPKMGFMILRCVKKPEHDQLWTKCYQSIRRFYPENPIVIIDDNSRLDLLSQLNLVNTTVIKSEYPGRGELLPYYYYLKTPFCQSVVIIHDSIIFQKKINLDVKNYKFLWEFHHKFDDTVKEIRMLEVIGDRHLVDYYLQKDKWLGCFGAMTVITHEYLKLINSKHNLADLLGVVKTRSDRMVFERIIGCLLQRYGKPGETLNQETPNINGDENKPIRPISPVSLFGNIFRYGIWGLKLKNIKKFSYFPVIKIWSGR